MGGAFEGARSRREAAGASNFGPLREEDGVVWLIPFSISMNSCSEIATDVLTPAGLANLGATCYMNSFLQYGDCWGCAVDGGGVVFSKFGLLGGEGEAKLFSCQPWFDFCFWLLFFFFFACMQVPLSQHGGSERDLCVESS